MSYGHSNESGASSANARLSSASCRWHSTSSASLRPGQIGSPIPRTRCPGELRASRNCFQTGMMRAGLPPISRMSAKRTARASRASAERSSSILALSTATSTASPASMPAPMNGTVPARNSSSPAYMSASCSKACPDFRVAVPALTRTPLVPAAGSSTKDARVPRPLQVRSRRRGWCLRPPCLGIPGFRPRHHPGDAARSRRWGWPSLRLTQAPPSGTCRVARVGSAA